MASMTTAASNTLLNRMTVSPLVRVIPRPSRYWRNPSRFHSHRLDGSRHLMDGGRIMTNRRTGPTVVERPRPLPIQHAKELQHYGTVARLPIALDAPVRRARIDHLNQPLAARVALRD